MNATWRRVALWGVLMVALAAALAYAFRPQPVLVDLAAVTRGPLVVTVDEEGETRVRDVFVLSAPVTGRALRIDSDVGDAVIAGETVVARVEPVDPSFLDVRSEAEAEAGVRTAEAARALAVAKLDEAEAEFDFAKAELKRARQLIRNQTISERTLDEAVRGFKTRQAAIETVKAELQMRESQLAQARARLLSPIETQTRRDDCDCIPILSPVTGRILRVVHESEGVVEAGAPLVEIGDPRDLEIVVDFLSTDAVRIETDQRVIIEEWGGETPLAGRVHRVEPFGFTKVSALGIEEQRVNVIIDFTDRSKHWDRLGHGYRVEARIVLWENENVLKLPLSALFRHGERWAVFVKEGSRAHHRDVTIGRRTDFEAEVTDGLEEGDWVILHPNDRIVDGVRIRDRS
jgi:HlyD family secretion protein